MKRAVTVFLLVIFTAPLFAGTETGVQLTEQERNDFIKITKALKDQRVAEGKEKYRFNPVSANLPRGIGIILGGSYEHLFGKGEFGDVAQSMQSEYSNENVPKDIPRYWGTCVDQAEWAKKWASKVDQKTWDVQIKSTSTHFFMVVTLKRDSRVKFTYDPWVLNKSRMIAGDQSEGNTSIVGGNRMNDILDGNIPIDEALRIHQRYLDQQTQKRDSRRPAEVLKTLCEKYPDKKSELHDFYWKNCKTSGHATRESRQQHFDAIIAQMYAIVGEGETLVRDTRKVSEPMTLLDEDS